MKSAPVNCRHAAQFNNEHLPDVETYLNTKLLLNCRHVAQFNNEHLPDVETYLNKKLPLNCRYAAQFNNEHLPAVETYLEIENSKHDSRVSEHVPLIPIVCGGAQCPSSR